MKIKTPYPNTNKAANFVRQIDQLHRSINKIIERSAMTVAEDHSCFLHGSCRVRIPVRIPFWFFVGFSLDTSTNVATASQIIPPILPSMTGPGAHPASCTMGTGSFPGEKSGRGVTLSPHPILVPWSRKSRAIPLLPLWIVGLYRASVPVQRCSLYITLHNPSFSLFINHAPFNVPICHGKTARQWTMASTLSRIHDHTQTHHTQ